MKFLLIGGSGQLGTELKRKFPDALVTYRTKEVPGGVKLDLADFVSLEDLILKTRPSLVINTAAFTDVDACEVRREEAWKVNGEAVRHLIRAARVVEAHVIHVSTDYVFDGSKGNYAETDLPNPVNYYGLTKLTGEIYASSYDDSLVIRTSGVFGWSGFPALVYRSLKEGREVRAFKGFYSPVSAERLAEAIWELASSYRTGLIHVAGERISRYELARRIAEEFGLDKGLIKEVEWIEGWRAKRPLDSSLDVSRAKRLISSDFYSLESNLKVLKSVLGKS